MPRGSDFAARWSEGVWAEERIIEAINAVAGFRAVRFGISDGTAFWSSREMAQRELPDQTGHGKRPDILVFDEAKLSAGEIDRLVTLYELSDSEVEDLTRRALLGIESEFSPYDYAARLRDYGKELSFTLKDEDLIPLRAWTDYWGVPLGLVQVFFDSSHYLSLASIVRGIESGEIRRQRERSYNKDVYYPPMSRGIRFGTFSNAPDISAEVIKDKYGKYTPYRKTIGGKLVLTSEMIAELQRPSGPRRTK